MVLLTILPATITEPLPISTLFNILQSAPIHTLSPIFIGEEMELLSTI